MELKRGGGSLVKVKKCGAKRWGGGVSCECENGWCLDFFATMCWICLGSLLYWRCGVGGWRTFVDRKKYQGGGNGGPTMYAYE